MSLLHGIVSCVKCKAHPLLTIWRVRTLSSPAFALVPNWGPPTTNALAALTDFVANFAPSQNHPCISQAEVTSIVWSWYAEIVGTNSGKSRYLAKADIRWMIFFWSQFLLLRPKNVFPVSRQTLFLAKLGIFFFFFFLLLTILDLLLKTQHLFLWPKVHEPFSWVVNTWQLTLSTWQRGPDSWHLSVSYDNTTTCLNSPGA